MSKCMDCVHCQPACVVDPQNPGAIDPDDDSHCVSFEGKE
jgi:hypothetical protein